MTSHAAHPAHPTRSARLGLLQVCAAGFLWGTGGLVVTILHDEDGLGALTTSAWRMLIAALALVAVTAVARRLGSLVTTFRAQPVLVVAVGSCTAVYQGLYFLAVLAVGVSVATVVSLGLAPVLAAGWEHARAGTRPERRELMVLAAALTGLVLVSVAAAGHGGPGDAPVLGLVLSIASGATFAATTVLGHHLARDVDPLALTTCATSVGVLLLAPFLLAAALGSGPVVTTRPGGLLLLLYLGVFTLALSYGLLYAGLRTTSGSAATVATLVEPLSAAALAVVLLDERLTAPAVVGGVLILAAVVGIRPREMPPAPT